MIDGMKPSLRRKLQKTKKRRKYTDCLKCGSQMHAKVVEDDAEFTACVLKVCRGCGDKVELNRVEQTVAGWRKRQTHTSAVKAEMGKGSNPVPVRVRPLPIDTKREGYDLAEQITSLMRRIK